MESMFFSLIAILNEEFVMRVLIFPVSNAYLIGF